MAVLFRAGHHSFNLEIFLQKKNISFVKVGGHRFVEGAHIKDLLSFLKIVANPRDVVAWERILRMQEGLGPKRAQEIFSLIKSQSDWPSRLEVLQGYRRLKTRLKPLTDVLNQLTEATLPPTQALEIIWSFYQTYLPRFYEEDHQRRQKEIEEIIRDAD